MAEGGIFLKKAGTIIFSTVILLWALASLPVGVEYASRGSLVGMIGSFVAPIFAPAGFGSWEAGVSLVFGFLAKEVVVGAFGTLFGVGEAGIHAVLPTLFTPLSAYAFMIMTLLYVPCVAVVAAVKKGDQQLEVAGVHGDLHNGNSMASFGCCFPNRAVAGVLISGNS